MKRLTYTMMVFLLLSVLSGCRQSQADKYQRYLEERNDTTFEYIEQSRDSVIDEDAAAVEAITDDDGLVAVPDIPKERAVNMHADDYETKKLMSGK
jgi:hypothetical protein